MPDIAKILSKEWFSSISTNTFLIFVVGWVLFICFRVKNSLWIRGNENDRSALELSPVPAVRWPVTLAVRNQRCKKPTMRATSRLLKNSDYSRLEAGVARRPNANWQKGL